jgi:hypothetical protein
MFRTSAFAARILPAALLWLLLYKEAVQKSTIYTLKNKT